MVSIIMPVYKVEEKLLRCSVESILRQTDPDLELLLIDDGSPDLCGKICDEYALKDKRVKAFHMENQGVSAARNLGLDKCAGDFVMFVDSDDYIAETCLEHLQKAMEETKSDYIKCSCKKVMTENDLNISNHWEYKIVEKREAIHNLCYMNIPFPGIEVTSVWAGLYKRQTIEKIRFNPSMAIGEDFEFNLRAFQTMNRIGYLACCEYGYLIRRESAMRKGFNERKLKVIEQLEILIKQNENSRYKEGIISRSVNIGIVLLLMIPVSQKYSEQRKYIAEFLKKYRLQTLRNDHTRLKVKAALIMSYMGFDVMQKIFERISHKTG